jgi:hypothetical protein
MGLHSLIAASPTGVVTAGSHTHRLSVLGVSHALDGFVRRLASRVCFTPQPRPGFALQGFIPRPQREHLVDAPCPLVGSRRITFASCPATPRSDAPPSGLCSASESGTSRWGLATELARSPLEFLLLQVLPLFVASAPSRPHPLLILEPNPSSRSRS